MPKARRHPDSIGGGDLKDQIDARKSEKRTYAEAEREGRTASIALEKALQKQD